MGWKATPTWASQYGLPDCTGSPQNQKSSVAGSPTGHLQVRSVNSIKLSFLAFFSISLTFASASGSISLAEGCGGRGWPAGMIGLIRLTGAAGVVSLGDSTGLVSCLGVFAAGLALVAGLAGLALLPPSAAPPEPLRLDRPRRCTLPMTALRVTPPSSLAIWLADWPSPHIFFSSSTRSSLQDMCPLSVSMGRPRVGCRGISTSPYSNHWPVSYKASQPSERAGSCRNSWKWARGASDV